MKLVIGNFKMNQTNEEVEEYLDFFAKKDYEHVFFAPTFIYLQQFVKQNLKTVAQDVSMFEMGAYTGDVSAKQLKSIGVNYAIIGHSERRKYYQDSLNINQKMKLLLNNGIVPILCIGEDYEKRQSNQVNLVLQKEIDEAFLDIDKSLLSSVIIAYEPIWAIGTGVIPTSEEIYDTIFNIKDYVSQKYSFKPLVLYGGSVNNKCIDTLEMIDNIDGYLVGGCSLNYQEFDTLIQKVH